jgi:hypothetical protein
MSLFLVCRSSLRMPCLPSTVLTRRAMMSGLPKGHATTTSPALPNSPPVSIPAEHISMSPDAAAPQTAAPPPPVPKLAKPRPKIRSTKAALTIVSSRQSLTLIPVQSNICFHHSDTKRCFTTPEFAPRANTTTYSYWCAEQGLRRLILPPGLR